MADHSIHRLIVEREALRKRCRQQEEEIKVLTDLIAAGGKEALADIIEATLVANDRVDTALKKAMSGLVEVMRQRDEAREELRALKTAEGSGA